MKKRAEMKRNILLIISILFALSSICLVYAQTEIPVKESEINAPVGVDPFYFYPYYLQDPMAQYGMTSEMCNNTGMDFIIQTTPDACTPNPVRSDLLEEQNVPVFCRLTALKINPLVQIPYIEKIEAVSDLKSPGVFSVTFHPANSAQSFMKSVKTGEQYKLEGVPTINDLGYLVIFLKQNPKESTMPGNITLQESLKITYSLAKSFGINENQKTLELLSNEKWQDSYEKYSFWQGKGYLRLEDLKDNKATISVYKTSRQKISSVTLRVGERSDELKLPGFYCGAGVQLQLDGIDTPKIRARLLVNGDELLVGKNENIGDSECIVSDIIPAAAFTGIVKIRCRNTAKTYVLELKNQRAEIILPGSSKAESFSVGDKISIDNKNYYIGYIGKEFQESMGQTNSYVIIFASKDRKELSSSERDKIISRLGNFVKEKIDSNEKISTMAGGDIKSELEKYKIKSIGEVWILTKSHSASLDEKTIKLESSTGIVEATYSSEVEEALSEALQQYEDVEYAYSTVQNAEKTTLYGIEALSAAAQLAGDFNKNEKQVEYLMKIVNKYKDVENAGGAVDEARTKLANLLSSDPGKASKAIKTPTGNYRISLLSIEMPGLGSESVDMTIDDSDHMLGLYDYLGDSYWQISEIKENSITLKCTGVNCGTSTDKINFGETRTLNVGSDFNAVYEKSGEQKLLTATLNGINLIKEAKVTVLPWEQKRTTITNFTINIGIEKRAIQLNPAKTSERISQLNNIIVKLEGIRDKLGNVVSAWKKACFAGATALWAKNFIQGLDGSALARRKTMDYWSEYCAEKVKNKDYQTISACYVANEKDINKDVSKSKEALKLANSFVSKVKSKEGVMKKSGLFGLGRTIDEAKFAEEAQKLLTTDETYSSLSKQSITYQQKTISVSSLDLTKLQKGNYIGVEDVKNIIYNLKMQEFSGKTGEEGLSSLLAEKTNIKNFAELNYYLQGVETVNLLETVKAQPDLDPGLKSLLEQSDSRVTLGATTLQSTVEKVKIGDVQKDAMVKVLPGLGSAVIILEETAGNYVPTGEIYKIKKDGNTISLGEKINVDEDESIKKALSEIVIAKVDPKRCVGNSIDVNDAKEIKFWDSGPYKGMVALMPIDKGDGFYVATRGYLAIEGAESYMGISGNINEYTIGNVGPNHKIEFDFTTGVSKKGGDDCSRIINLQQGADVSVPGVDSAKAKRLNDKAITCIKQATEQYNKGSRKITTDCGTFDLGKPPAVTPTAECEDFMSPSDCKILYNLCDPVLCPASRCNLGGKYPVSNVMSTGIIGSLVLCLPNFDNGKGVLVPICLTGVHAGLDNLIVTLKSARDCLQKNIETGEMTGICDEILSLYLCDFLWQNLDPFIKMGTSALSESIGNRGGGEYAIFSESWKNSLDSINYFKDYYGMSTFNAFKERSTAQAGTEVCKRFMSIAYPTQAKFWDELSKPESETQFFATMQEFENIGGTQSHYKVYYIIYAGQDHGVSFRIYLRNPPAAGYYQIPDRYYVPNAFGYIAVGQYKSETPDFIAPYGYKEICVEINGQEHCGFGQASSNFLANEIQDRYLQQLLNKPVTKSEDCASGAPTLLPSASLNIQSIASSMIKPAIYKRGIIRICSSEDPGKGTEQGRYKLIGYCDNQAVGCYLDMDSVEDAIKDLGVEESIAINADKSEQEQINNYINEIGLEPQAISQEKLREVEKAISGRDGIEERVKKIEADVKEEVDNFIEGIKKLKNLDYTNINVADFHSKKAQDIDFLVAEIDGLLIKLRDISDKCVYDSEKARAELDIGKLLDAKARVLGAEEKAKADAVLEPTCVNNGGTWQEEACDERTQEQVQASDAGENPGKFCCRPLTSLPSEGYSALFSRWPVDASPVVSSCYGYRDRPGYDVEWMHEGIDIIASKGTDVIAVANGKVTKVVSNCEECDWNTKENCECNGNAGNQITISSGDIRLIYYHLGEVKVKEGRDVSAGQEIGTVGSTGWSSGAHLHFQVEINGVELDINYGEGSPKETDSVQPLCFFTDDIVNSINFEESAWEQFSKYFDHNLGFGAVPGRENTRQACIPDAGYCANLILAQAPSEYEAPPKSLIVPSEFSKECHGQHGEITEKTNCKDNGIFKVNDKINSILNRYNEIISDAASRYGVDAELIKAVIYVESQGKSDAKSRAGAVGLMQLMPDTAKELGLTVDSNTDERLDPSKNIDAGTEHLSNMIKSLGGNIELGLAAYNTGKSNVNKGCNCKDSSCKNVEFKDCKLSEETENYVPKVMFLYNSLKESPEQVCCELNKISTTSTTEKKATAEEQCNVKKNPEDCMKTTNCWYDHVDLPGYGGVALFDSEIGTADLIEKYNGYPRCRLCPPNKKCGGDFNWLLDWRADITFRTPEDCEYWSDISCEIKDCYWDDAAKQCKKAEFPHNKLQSLVNNFEKEYKSSENLLNNPEGIKEQDKSSAQTKIKALKTKLDYIKEYKQNNNIIDTSADGKIREWEKSISNALEILQTAQVMIVSSKDGSSDFTSESKIVEYSDNTKVCAILSLEEDYYNNELAEKKVKIGDDEKEIKKTDKEVTVTWYKIVAHPNHKIVGTHLYNYDYPDVRDPSNGEMNADYYGYQNLKDNALWSSGKDTIQYQQLEEGTGWCIDAARNVGTYYYRAEVQIQGQGQETRKVSSLGKPLSETGKQLSETSYSQVYNGAESTLLEPDAYDFAVGGIKNSVHRISRKSNYKDTHSGKVTMYQDIRQLEFVAYIESLVNVPWIWGATSDQVKNLVGMQCYDVAGQPACMTLNIAPFLTSGVTAIAEDDFLNMRYEDVYYYNSKDKLIYQVTRFNPDGTAAVISNEPVNLVINQESVNAGDLFLLSHDGKSFYHTLIFYDEASPPNGFIDGRDMFIYMRSKEGIKKDPYLEKYCSSIGGCYFKIKRINLLVSSSVA